MLQRWMDSKIGQTFLNYAYSWGASVVILGTLFKLTHLPGANLMLFIGMGTEVVVFFLSAFDRPFEKGSDDETETSAQPAATGFTAATGGFAMAGGSEPAAEGFSPESAPQTGGSATGGVAGGGTFVGGGTIVIGGGSAAPAATSDDSTPDYGTPDETSAAADNLQAAASAQGLTGGSLLEIIRLANEELLQRAQASLTPEMEEASKQYVEKLQLLTETLDRVEKQSARLTTDSEEMTNLNRTLTGINTVYELQLKSVSQQIGTIDNINEQTRRMAAQIEELNGVYSRMVKALTVNMKNAAATSVD
jgi:hypothetical protein